MNVKRFVGRTSHEALGRLKAALGPDAVVLSTRPCAEGVEILAMGPEAMSRQASDVAQDVEGDAQTLSMSTLSFQDYVRERMLKRRQAEMKAASSPAAALQPSASFAAATQNAMRSAATGRPVAAGRGADLHERARAQAKILGAADAPAADFGAHVNAPAAPSVRRIETLPTPSVRSLGASAPSASSGMEPRHFDQASMLEELRSMKGLIEQRFSALTFLERLQRQPGQARLAQRLLEVGFSPALARKLTELLPQDAPSEERWASAALERNLRAAEQMPAIEDQGGVIALIGSTGVGKTTTTAKLAAAFASKHGASALGLITLDAYRVGAQEQLRAYGRILGVPVHSAHDRASLEDLLSLLSDKRLVLIDTAGMAQRDSRTREMLDMLSHPSIKRVLVLSAAAQGETLDDVVISWRAASCQGVVLSKVDEAVRLAPALDVLIRHKLAVLGIANGQRVPEDWHRLTAQALVQRALREPARGHWRLDSESVELIFADSSPTAPWVAASTATEEWRA